MFQHQFDETPNNVVVAHWFLMSFNAGCINAGGFLATGKFVSHVTGFATLFGVDLANSRTEAALSILSVPLFFLIGSVIAGLLIDRPIYKNKSPHFDWVMGLSAVCLFLCAGGGFAFGFRSLGQSLRLDEAYSLLALLCLACGLQNAAITSSSRSSVRVTHLTGLTTDLGLSIARLVTISRKGALFAKEIRASWLRLGSILSFVIGSAAGAWFFTHNGYHGFIYSGLIAAYAAWHGRKAKIS